MMRTIRSATCTSERKRSAPRSRSRTWTSFLPFRRFIHRKACGSVRSMPTPTQRRTAGPRSRFFASSDLSGIIDEDRARPMKPRVLVLTTYYYPVLGGVETHARQLVNHLHQKGFEVE